MNNISVILIKLHLKMYFQNRNTNKSKNLSVTSEIEQLHELTVRGAAWPLIALLARRWRFSHIELTLNVYRKVIGLAFTLFIAPTQFQLNYFYGRANCYLLLYHDY